MAKQIQLRRGTTTENNDFKGALGEVTVDTDKEVLVVHDGVTAGGFPVAARANANGTISLIKKDGTVITTIPATGLFNNTLTSTATDQALTASQGKVLQDNKLDKTAITASGSAPMYACRAWADWDGVNNILNASGNISSVTDNGVGDFTFNFITAMPDINYAVSAIIKRPNSDNAFVYEAGTRTITSCRLKTKQDDSNAADGEISMILVR